MLFRSYLLDLSAAYHPFGTLDSNTYCNPYNSSAVSRVWAPSSNVLDQMTLSAWQSLTGQDAHSKMMYKKPASYERDTIIVNTTGSTATLMLQPYLYHDMYGNPISVSVTLPAYSSKILLRDSMKVNVPLPVELISFTVSNKNGSAVLDWKTATEINNYGFDIEKKQSLTDPASGTTTAVWSKIGFMDGSGTSNVAHAYTFTDPSPSPVTISYRLKQIDRDGQFVYSKEVMLSLTSIPSKGLPTEFALGQNYPNPFNPSTNVEFSIPTAQMVSLKIYDVTGREVATLVHGQTEPGKYSVQWNAGNLSSGVYVYRLTAGSYTSAKKLLLQK